MHYTAEQGHKPALRYDPFKAIVSPRPIGWISTRSALGVPNLGPYSFFTAIASRPNMIAFSSDGLKDSARNARDTGEFVFNLATMDLLEAMNASSAEVAPEVNEFDLAGIAMAPALCVKAPRVAAAAAALECRTTSFQEIQDIEGRGIDRYLIIGQVVATHIDDRFLKDGRFDTAAARPLARLGYKDYAVVDSVFELSRPDEA